MRPAPLSRTRRGQGRSLTHPQRSPAPSSLSSLRSRTDTPARRTESGIMARTGPRPVQTQDAVPARAEGRIMRPRTAAGATRSGAGRTATVVRLHTNAPDGRTAAPPDRSRTSSWNVRPAGKRRKRKCRFRLDPEQSSDRRGNAPPFLYAASDCEPSVNLLRVRLQALDNALPECYLMTERTVLVPAFCIIFQTGRSERKRRELYHL